jgi:hypothetical protein
LKKWKDSVDFSKIKVKLIKNDDDCEQSLCAIIKNEFGFRERNYIKKIRNGRKKRSKPDATEESIDANEPSK